MGLEETKEPGALGQPRKQRPIIARQPPIEGAVADAFERMQQSQGDHLTGPAVGLRVIPFNMDIFVPGAWRSRRACHSDTRCVPVASSWDRVGVFDIAPDSPMRRVRATRWRTPD